MEKQSGMELEERLAPTLSISRTVAAPQSDLAAAVLVVHCAAEEHVEDERHGGAAEEAAREADGGDIEEGVSSRFVCVRFGVSGG
jgi:hypothetical protein